MWVRQLPAIQMLCYFNSIMGYLSTIVCFPVFLIVPVVSVYTKTHPVKELTTVRLSRSAHCACCPAPAGLPYHRPPARS